MTDRNQICRPGRVSTLPDAQPRPTNRQTSFSGRGDVCSASGHIVNKFRRPAILQLNIEGLTASKMNVFHHLAVQFESSTKISFFDFKFEFRQMNIQNRHNFFSAGAHAIKKMRIFRSCSRFKTIPQLFSRVLHFLANFDFKLVWAICRVEIRQLSFLQNIF